MASPRKPVSFANGKWLAEMMDRTLEHMRQSAFESLCRSLSHRPPVKFWRPVSSIRVSRKNMVTVYVSASSREKALGIMSFLKSQPGLKRKIEFNVPWVDHPNLPQGDEAVKRRVDENLAAIKQSDLVVLAADYDKIPGGKFVEVGYAAALGRPVLVLGRRENMYVEALAHSFSFNLEVLAGKLKELIADQFSVKAETPRRNAVPVVRGRTAA
jgi:hypothetical protein